MPRAAPAGAHPAARLNSFVARGVGRMENKMTDYQNAARAWACWRTDRLAEITTGTGATRIRDGLVFCYVEDGRGWPEREGTKKSADGEL
jgi:hypothetical protein